jgi:hypothetical protein
LAVERRAPDGRLRDWRILMRVVSQLVVVAGIATLLVVHPAKGQSAYAWATDGSLGAVYGKGGEFLYRSNFGARAGLSVRRDLRNGIGWDAEGGYEWMGFVQSGDAICGVDSHGGCMTVNFPTLSGPSGVVGVSLRPANVIELRLNVGMADYAVNSTRLGAPLAAVDIAPFPNWWCDVVVGARAVDVPNYRGYRLLVSTFSLGVRLRGDR